MSDRVEAAGRVRERARRREARKTIGAYHEEEMRLLLDELIHRYKRSARELWKFCGSSGSAWERAVRALEYLRD